MTRSTSGVVSSRTEHAHAKINLLLRILSREVSGYHGIETLFQRVALHDVVTVRVGDMERSLRCDGPTMPHGGLGPAHENLAWRAAALYARESGWETGWEIGIDKRIPVGGGLGGGSADAAAVLRAMEALSPTKLGDDRLIALGGTLGADVAFFVSGASLAWAWGRGDRLLALPPLPSMPVLLVTFAEGVNTGAAYRALAAQREAAGVAPQAHAFALSDFATWPQIARIAMNDFEAVVPSLHEGVARVLPELRVLAATGAPPGDDAASRPQEPRIAEPRIAMMSGSGATCFLVAPDATSLRVSSDWQVTHTRTT